MAGGHKPQALILIDTNILAYALVPGLVDADHRLRARLARWLLTRGDVAITVYDEQLYEIRRALDDLAIRGRIRPTLRSKLWKRYTVTSIDLLRALRGPGERSL